MMMNSKTDREILEELPELGAAVIGVTRKAMAGSLDPEGFALQSLEEMEETLILLANTNGCGQSQYPELDGEQEDHSANRNSCRGYVSGCSDEVADPNCIGCNRRSSLQKAAEKAGVFFAQGDRSWWLTEPPLGRVADGVAYRVGQLRALGNGQVPAVVRFIWSVLTQ